MSAVKQRDLARFKKTREGLIEFALILEQAPPKTREKILKEVGEIDPSFLKAALKKVVYFEEIIYLDESVLAEVISHVSPRVLACALHGMQAAFEKQILETLSFRAMKQVLEEKEKMGQIRPSVVLGARTHILKAARQLEAKDKIIFELLDCPRFQAKKKKHLRLVGKQ